jgi:hypothetical protein
MCKKCGKLIAVVLIGAVGGEVLQHHECRDMKTELWCRAQDDMESRHNPYRPASPSLRLGIATTTSASVVNSDVILTDFRSLLK